MNQETKKPLIIGAIIFVALFVLLAIIGIATMNNNDNVTQEDVYGEITTDPVSGEEIAKGSEQSQTGAGSPGADRPAMLGFGKLADYGMTAEQRAKVNEQLTKFAKSQDPEITRYSFYKDSYRQQLPDDNGIAHMTFMVQANQKTDYFVDVSYSGTTDANVSVYEEDKTTLLFTE